MGIAVAPDNPDVIYVANHHDVEVDGRWKIICGFKGAPGGDDYQRIWISTENPQIIALSSDQGAVISVNGGVTWSSWYNQPTAQFYHVTTDNRFPYWVYGAQQESGSAATQSRSDDGEITFRDWRLIGIFEYGYIAVDPLDPNILYGDWLTRTKQDIGEYAKVTPEPIRRANIAMRARCRWCSRRSNRTRSTSRPTCFQDHRCGKQLAGHQSGSHARILRNSREPRRFRRERSGKRKTPRRHLRGRSFVQGGKHHLGGN